MRVLRFVGRIAWGCLYVSGWLVAFCFFWWLMIPYYLVQSMVRGAVRAELRRAAQ